jgi:hypothetical protein
MIANLRTTSGLCEIDLSKSPSGLYVIKASDGNKTEVRKIHR